MTVKLYVCAENRGSRASALASHNADMVLHLSCTQILCVGSIFRDIRSNFYEQMSSSAYFFVPFVIAQMYSAIRGGCKSRQ
jgi:hypothetical protein